MSFTFQWPRFSDQFHSDAIQMLNNALNKGDKPPVIADKIEVVELEMGTQPPELEIRDIGDLTTDQFRGIFRLTYAGDAHLVLKTKVQANPLNHKQPDIHLMTGSRGMLAAQEPLIVPMLLRLSHFKLNSYVVLVVSKQKGITLVFKTDPLQNVDINSTFDSIAVIQNFIQREIEGQLRQMFREDLPGIIHRLSQQWVKAKVEAPYLDKRPPPIARRPFDPTRRVRSISGISVASSTRKTSKSVQSSRPTPVLPSPSEPTSSLPDLEYFDPTYGLRPEDFPTKSVFSGFGRLFRQNKGLADLTEESSEVDDDSEREVGDDDKTSYSMVDWEGASTDYSPPASLMPDDSVTEYETIPAVGGGTITRPRVYHSQSMIQPPTETSRTATLADGYAPRASTFVATTSRRPITPDSIETQFSRSTSSGLARSIETPPTSDSPYSAHSHHHDATHKPLPPPSLSVPPPSFRRLSVSSSHSLPVQIGAFHLSSPPAHHTAFDNAHNTSINYNATNPGADPKIVLGPAAALNSSTLHQLSTLSSSNHTLSPYTRSLAHFAVRSGPPRTLNASGVRTAPERRPPVKAKRKRTYRIGGGAKAAMPPPPVSPQSRSPSSVLAHDYDHDHDRTLPHTRTRMSAPPSPTPSSEDLEFDLSGIDRYFRSGDGPGNDPPDGGKSSTGAYGQWEGKRMGKLPPWVSTSSDASRRGSPPPRYSHDAYETLRRRR